MIELVDTPDVFGSTIFCDDIRQESNGKFLLIGVYQGVILMNVAFPVKIPRLALVVSVSQKVDKFHPHMVLHIFLPGDSDEKASLTAEFGENEAGALLKHADANADAMGLPVGDRHYTTAHMNLQWDGLEIKQPGSIKVRVDIGGKRYKLGTIQVRPNPQIPQQTPPPSAPAAD